MGENRVSIDGRCNVIRIEGAKCSSFLRIDYGDGRVTRGSSTKVVISQLWVIIFRHAIHD